MITLNQEEQDRTLGGFQDPVHHSTWCTNPVGMQSSFQEESTQKSTILHGNTQKL